jgi:asparagine synthetase B (glutamine-hydrolysing)
MDLNIGAALWLAARGKGTLKVFHGGNGTAVQTRVVSDGMTYKSAARMVLVGHGADEQCAGYGRHRTKSKRTVSAFLNPNLLGDKACRPLVPCYVQL